MNVTARWITRLIFLLLLVSIVAGIKVFGTKFMHREGGSTAGYSFDSFVMGSVMTVTIRDPDKSMAEKGAGLVLDEVHRITGIFDPRDPDSEISRLNNSPHDGVPLAISADMSLVLSEALHIRAASGGLFEPALGELIDLWGFNSESAKHELPDPARIKALEDSLSWGAGIRLGEGGKTVILEPGTGHLDLGAITAGYAVDRAVALLRENGIRNALVNLTGEIGVLGVGSNGRSWRVGVQHPRKTASHLGVIEQVEGIFVATSGDYERYFVKDGRRYHHILDPRTGFSAKEGAAVSVTVIASSCIVADAASTAAFVLGPEEGVKFLDNLGCQGLIVYAADGGTESGKLAYRATEGFLRIMKPDLEGLPIL